MNYYTLKNATGRTSSYFAETEDRAFELALEFGHARTKDSLKLVRAKALDPIMFPHEGSAALRVAPGPVVYVATRKLANEYVSFDQFSNDLEAEA